ncbi:hypothetical protein [Phormidium nigroviride]
MGLDAVEIVMTWENSFGIEISDDEAIAIATIKQAIDLISSKVNASGGIAGVCLGARAFYRIRQAFYNVGLPRKQIQLDSKWVDILPNIPQKKRQETLNYICDRAGLPKAPAFSFHFGAINRRITVRSLVDWAVANYPCSLTSSEERWTHFQVRSVVRSVIRDLADISDRDFKDDDAFAYILGIF